MGTSNSKSNKVVFVKKLITGTNKHFPNGNQQVQLGGSTHTIADVVAALNAFVALREDSESAKATAKAKLQAEKAQAPALLVLIAAWVLFIRASFGNSPEILGDFGLSPRKAKKPLTSEEQAIAAAKARATREARGTKSKKAKQAIHGHVTAKLVVTPLDAPQPASPAAAPPAGGAQPSAGAQPSGAGSNGTTHGP